MRFARRLCVHWHCRDAVGHAELFVDGLGVAALLLSLDVENVKCFDGSRKLRLAPITLIFGPNSAGKSSLLQALLLVVQSLLFAEPDEPPLVLQGPYVD